MCPSPPGMSPLLPHPSAYSRRRQSSQQSVIASGRLQLILLEEFHQPPLPKLLRGSLVTSQIPPRTRLQSQTLQAWDTRVRLSGQHSQPPKAQVLRCISSSMISCCIFQAVPASVSRAAHCFPSPLLSLMHSLGALRARMLFRAGVEHRLVSSQMLLGTCRKSLRLGGYPPAQPLLSQADTIASGLQGTEARETELLGASQFQSAELRCQSSALHTTSPVWALKIRLGRSNWLGGGHQIDGAVGQCLLGFTTSSPSLCHRDLPPATDSPCPETVIQATRHPSL